MMRTGTRGAWGVWKPRDLMVTRFPSVIVPECVLKCVPEGEYGVSKMACVSACMKMDDGLMQTGDTNGEPGGPQRVISVTAPVPRDTAYEARSAFRERPSRASSWRDFGSGTSRVSEKTVARTVKMAASVR